MKNDGRAGVKPRRTLDEYPALAQINQVGLATRSHADGRPTNRLDRQPGRSPALDYFSIHVDEVRLN
jgi:hypothetical protein